MIIGDEIGFNSTSSFNLESLLSKDQLEKTSYQKLACF